MPEAEVRRRNVLRDQQRALFAYDAVGGVPSSGKSREAYKSAVFALGTNILRSGLCAAIASVQRLNDDGGRILIRHLANASVPGLAGATAENFASRVRDLDADSYMMATREILQVATWLKRAVQATFEDT